MKLAFLVFLVEVSMGLNVTANDRQFVSANQTADKQQWVKDHLLLDGQPPFSFTYGGNLSVDLLKTWNCGEVVQQLDAARTQHVLSWRDPAGGLEIRLVGVDYQDYPAVEWTVYFKNTGNAATPILTDIHGMELAFARRKHQATLRTIRGDDCSAGSYAPIVIPLTDKPTELAPVGGRPCNAAFPYFNLDWGRDGVILALGWPGQWSARFVSDDGKMRVNGGQQTTKMKLEPGEEIRTPLNVALFWEGDWLHGQNLWRRWMVAHNLPRPGGKLPGTFTAACMGLHQSMATEKTAIDAYLKAGITFDYWWMDAGWYEGANWWDAKGVGTWTPDPERFPKGIREVSDYVHSKGMKLVLWFEPERVHSGSWLWENHPDWLLKHWSGGVADKQNMLLNLGNPQARQWLTDHVDHFITEQGVDLYRQDHNIDPLDDWRYQEPADRQGITENFHVQGYLAFWDELLRRHPGMLIDSCASGGRRNDLETLRRAVPLLRSDFQAPAMNPIPPDIDSGNQCQTWGLALWVPYYGSGVDSRDTYDNRSHLCPAMGMGTDLAKPHLAEALQQRLGDYRRIAELFYGDYYPLTAYSRDDEVWAAWQFVRPEKDDGMIQIFRRAHSPYQSATFPLRGLRPEARYAFTDIDTGKTTQATGAELMDTGLPVTMPTSRLAVILTFALAP